MFKTLYKISIIFLIVFSQLSLFGQTGIPDAPNPPRLVNDYSNLLTAEERMSLEQRLVSISDTTSVQIVVVITPTLNDYEISDFAQRLGQKWGVGSKNTNNGYVVIVKPKSSTERGEAFIATGYGSEIHIPDAICSQIVNREMIPFFKENNYFEGIVAGVTSIQKYTAGQYQAETPKEGIGGYIFLIILLIFIIFVIAKGNSNNNNKRTISSKGSYSPIFFPNIGGWTSGGGGGSSGGFGGFGGGSFGGGGAGGSW